MGFGLLEDHVFQAPLHIVQPAQRERRCGGRHQGLGLAMEPAVFHAQRGDVLEHHVQQIEQAGANGGLVFGGKRQAISEVAQHQLHRRYGRGGLAQQLGQLLGHFMHACIVFAQRGQRVVDQAGQQFCQVFGQDGQRGGFGGHGFGGGRVEPQIGVAHHHALQRCPVPVVHRPLQLAQQPLLCQGLAREHPQNVF